MRRTAALISALAVVASLAAAAPAASSTCEGVLCAGAARADITPPVTTPMWGYNARAFYSQPDRFLAQHTRAVDTDLYTKAFYLRSEGVLTRLYARALVLRNVAGVEAALVQVDLGAMTGEMWLAVAKRLAGSGIPIPRENLLISATHTHGGPGAIQQPPAHGLLVGDNYDPRVVARTVEGIVRAIEEAHARLAPARVAVGRGEMHGASSNRALAPHRANPCPDPEAVADATCDHDPGGESSTHAHAIDPIVTMVRADLIDGTPLGAWTSFAAHGTVFGGDMMLFHGDNQGVAERLVEQGIAARAAAKGIALPSGHEIVAAYANGAEGDVSPRCGGYNPYSCAEQTGIHQAQHVLALYDALEAGLTDDVALDSRLDVLYMVGQEDTSPVAILGAGPTCPLPVTNIIPGHGNKCPFLVLSGTGPQWFWLQAMRIGDTLLANVPGEMSVQLSRRVRKRILDSPANRDANGDPIVSHAAVVGLANDYMAYLTTPQEYDLQQYEGTFTLWGREQGPMFTRRMGELSDALLRGLAGPAYVEPPDTSETQAKNVSPGSLAAAAVPSADAGTVLTPVSATVERGSVASFAWVGGPPSVEVVPDEPFVETQREVVPGAWEPAFWDEGLEDLLDYWREGLEDRWGTQWDVPLDAPAGTYRFVVRGREQTPLGVVPYQVTSGAFTVVPSDDLGIAAVTPSASGLRVRATYPGPAAPAPGRNDTCSVARGAAGCNFRLRSSGPTTQTATIEAVVDGSPVTATGTYAGTPGVYDFPSITSPNVEVVAFTDGHGNSTQ